MARRTMTENIDDNNVLDALFFNDDGLTSGQEIVSNDEGYHIILGCSQLYDDLPPGNKWYEDTIATFCASNDDGSLKADAATVSRLLIEYMGVNKAGSNSFTTALQATFWAMPSGKPSKDSWKQARFYQVTSYKTLKEKVKTALKSRMDEVKPSAKKRPHGTDDNDDRMTESIGSKLEKIKSCRDIDDFIKMYEYGGMVHDCLQRISEASRGRDPEEWAKEWAQQLLIRDKEANSLDRDRKVSLELLYTLCNRWKGIKGEVTISEDEIVNDFQSKRIKEILRLCLVMDRTKMLYFMTGFGRAEPGMHWYAERHFEHFSEDLKQIVMEYGGEPSINKRYLWLLDLKRLGLDQIPILQKWTTPTLAPSSTRPEPYILQPRFDNCDNLAGYCIYSLPDNVAQTTYI